MSYVVWSKRLSNAVPIPVYQLLLSVNCLFTYRSRTVLAKRSIEIDTKMSLNCKLASVRHRSDIDYFKERR
jgi:hypothetical protein